MVAIIGCESNYVHYKPDGTVLKGAVDRRDSGAAQINEGYHPEADTEDLWKNLSYARHLYDTEGTTPWVCRKLVASR